MKKQDEQTIVICIPGQWENRDAIVKAIETLSGGYTFSGMMLIHSQSKDSFGLEVYEHDEQLRNAFESAASDTIPEKDLQAIEKHTFALYIIGTGGSMEAAQKIMAASQALLKAGGLGVKVETSGKSFSPAQWDAICKLEGPSKFYDAFIIKLQAQEDVFYTCGMHNLGLKDTIVGAVDMYTASQALDLFSMYQIVEQPEIKDGESFFVSEKVPEFQIWEEKDSRFPQDDSFHNRHGLWILEPMF